ncbi:hypothetical protein [Aquimarina litoralis]|uniref:hypothetical protein n=1 Tax=Aquimarina litoralis TaxID=584605 RepID=UPI001C55E968|nr:hypothetical protein [Aquimarina litoralis]MBW1294001.1 hypothetical protein [Aquimarina litoralis]
MKRFILLITCFGLMSCAKQVEPTVENINKIFASQDFTFEFHKSGESKKSISFRNDYLVYKSDQPTFRREITYDEVLLINDFIQNIVNLHQNNVEETPSYYVIKNTAYKAKIIPKQEDYYFEALLKTLKLIK